MEKLRIEKGTNKFSQNYIHIFELFYHSSSSNVSSTFS